MVSWLIVADEKPRKLSVKKSLIKFGAPIEDAYTGDLVTLQSNSTMWKFENSIGFTFNNEQFSTNTSYTGYINTMSPLLMRVDKAAW